MHQARGTEQVQAMEGQAQGMLRALVTVQALGIQVAVATVGAVDTAVVIVSLPLQAQAIGRLHLGQVHTQQLNRQVHSTLRPVPGLVQRVLDLAQQAQVLVRLAQRTVLVVPELRIPQLVPAILHQRRHLLLLDTAITSQHRQPTALVLLEATARIHPLDIVQLHQLRVGTHRQHQPIQIRQERTGMLSVPVRPSMCHMLGQHHLHPLNTHLLHPTLKGIPSECGIYLCYVSMI